MNINLFKDVLQNILKKIMTYILETMMELYNIFHIRDYFIDRSRTYKIMCSVKLD